MFFVASPPHFNPLPPHGGRLTLRLQTKFTLSFQSTPSAWRETEQCPHVSQCRGISIHSLRMEGDDLTAGALYGHYAFQSTPSAWRETPAHDLPGLPTTHFNPLPPHGGRPRQCWNQSNIESPFQSTPSAWRETAFGQGSALQSPYFNPLPPHGGRRRRPSR